MNFDHSEFIARQRRRDRTERDSVEKPTRNVWLMLLLATLYLLTCVSLVIVLDIESTTFFVVCIAFVAAAFFAFFMQRFLSSYALQEKQRRLTLEVLEGSRGARLVTDASGEKVYSNKKFDELCKSVGASGLESLIALFPDDQVTQTSFETLSEHAQRGLTDSIELRSSGENRDRWFMVTVQPISGWAGYIHWRIDDITQQREVDRSMWEEREKLIDFTDNAPVGFFSVDGQGRFVFVNATLARWLGEDIQTLLAEGFLHAYIETLPNDAAPYDISDKGGARQVTEVNMKGPGGRLFLASINQTVVHENDGRVRTRAVVHDLTSEREMRLALQESEDRFQRFFEEAPLGIAIIDSAGVVNDSNGSLATMLSLSESDLNGKSLQDLVVDDDRDTVLAAMNRIEKGRQIGKPLDILLKGMNKDIPVQLHARKFSGSENIVLQFIDLTEQKELEQQFVQSQKMQAIGQLAGGVAHDFNNLLTAITGFCDLLLLRHKPGDPSFGDIMQIKQNSNRAANLVRQLLAFSRQQTLRPKVHDVTDILTEVSHLIRRLIGTNIELDLVHGQNLGLIRVDVGQMEQVLINLAVNARDAMENGGSLSIKTADFQNEKPFEIGGDSIPPGRWVKIDVTDTGCGISESNLSRIFEPFFTTKDVGQGTGLGLATVHGIIRQTGGFLDVSSRVDEGTTFSIYLPCLSEKEAKDAVHEEKEVEDHNKDLTGTERILLVEDEDAVRTFSSRALMNKGYEVLDADCGESALSLMEGQESRHIDLLITDVMMPNMDGPTLAQRMRQDSPNLKIIFISGYTEDRLKDYMGDNIYFLPKPFTLKQLAAKVKEAMEA